MLEMLCDSQAASIKQLRKRARVVATEEIEGCISSAAENLAVMTNDLQSIRKRLMVEADVPLSWDSDEEEADKNKWDQRMISYILDDVYEEGQGPNLVELHAYEEMEEGGEDVNKEEEQEVPFTYVGIPRPVF